MIYFRPDIGVCVRDATTRSFAPSGDTPAYRDVTHIRGVPIRDDSVTVKGDTLEGIFSPFDSETVIDSWWEGQFREVFRRGAFAQTLHEDRQISQFDHGMSSVLDSLPLGPFEKLEETSEGLFGRVRMRDTPLVNEVRAAIADGSVTGASIAFRVRDEKVTEGKRDDLDLREVLNVRLFEAGPVVWPAYPDTHVEVVSQPPVTEHDTDTIGLDGAPDRIGAPPIEDGSPDSTGVTSTARARIAAARLRLNL